MSVTYVGLIQGNLNPIDLVKMIQRHYGGHDFSIHFTSTEDHFQICFKQNYTEEQMAMRPWERAKVATKRMMNVHINGACKCDYAHVTDENMTYISLGHSGDAPLIIDSLVRVLNGYVKDEMGPTPETTDEFVRLEVLEEARRAAVAKHEADIAAVAQSLGL